MNWTEKVIDHAASCSYCLFVLIITTVFEEIHTFCWPLGPPCFSLRKSVQTFLSDLCASDIVAWCLPRLAVSLLPWLPVCPCTSPSNFAFSGALWTLYMAFPRTVLSPLFILRGVSPELMAPESVSLPLPFRLVYSAAGCIPQFFIESLLHLYSECLLAVSVLKTQ